MKLTKSAVDRIQPPGTGQAFYRDEVIQGFALRVTSGGAKSFIVEKRIRGQVRRKTLGRYGALTVEQARQEAQKFLGQVATGADPIAEKKAAVTSRVTLSEAFETYLATRKGLKASTVTDYRRLMNEVFPDWQSKSLATLTKDAVAERHAKYGARSPARANNAMRLLRALFNFARGQYEDAHGRSLFPENPVGRLSQTRAWFRVDRRRTLIKLAELPAWYEAVMALKADPEDVPGATVADLLLVLLLTGLRRSEALNLQWQDLDFTERTLSIRETKNREPLRLPLSDYLHDVLKARQAVAEAAHKEALRKDPEAQPSPYVFPGRANKGRLIEPRPQMRKVTERSGVDFTLHDLRRTFITAAESLAIPYYALKQLVNHKLGSDVTAGYIVTNVERLREPMQQVTNYLLSAMGARSATVLSWPKTPAERVADAD